jgi:hypothetical protein
MSTSYIVSLVVGVDDVNPNSLNVNRGPKVSCTSAKTGAGGIGGIAYCPPSRDAVEMEEAHASGHIVETAAP